MDSEKVITKNLCDKEKIVNHKRKETEKEEICYGDRLEKGEPKCGCPKVSLLCIYRVKSRSNRCQGIKEFICYKRNSVIANMKNKREKLQGIK